MNLLLHRDPLHEPDPRPSVLLGHEQAPEADVRHLLEQLGPLLPGEVDLVIFVLALQGQQFSFDELPHRTPHHEYFFRKPKFHGSLSAASRPIPAGALNAPARVRYSIFSNLGTSTPW